MLKGLEVADFSPSPSPVSFDSSRLAAAGGRRQVRILAANVRSSITFDDEKVPCWRCNQPGYHDLVSQLGGGSLQGVLAGVKNVPINAHVHHGRPRSSPSKADNLVAHFVTIARQATVISRRRSPRDINIRLHTVASRGPDPPRRRSARHFRDEGFNHYGQKWVKASERKDLNLTTYQSTVPGNSLVSHKAVCVIKNILPEQVMAFFVDDIQRRLAWDKGAWGCTFLAANHTHDGD